MKPDCKFYPMCDHKDFLIGVVCDACPWRVSRMIDARRELEAAQRRVSILTALMPSERPSK